MWVLVLRASHIHGVDDRVCVCVHGVLECAQLVFPGRIAEEEEGGGDLLLTVECDSCSHSFSLSLSPAV